MNVSECVRLENNRLFAERINERNVPYKIFSGGNLTVYDFVKMISHCWLGLPSLRNEKRFSPVPFSVRMKGKKHSKK